jgi:hypothetical protein
MLSSDETKAGGKPRKARPAQVGEKARKRKAAARVPEVDQPPGALETVDEAVAVAETAAPAETREAVAFTAAPAPLPSSAETSSTDASPAVPDVAKETAPVSYRSFADAWGNYSRTSLEQTRAYFEKLAGVHSLGAAFEVQAEFAKQACDTFVAQSQKIGELQGKMARQRLKRLEGFLTGMAPGARRS